MDWAFRLSSPQHEIPSNDRGDWILQEFVCKEAFNQNKQQRIPSMQRIGLIVYSLHRYKTSSTTTSINHNRNVNTAAALPSYCETTSSSRISTMLQNLCRTQKRCVCVCVRQLCCQCLFTNMSHKLSVTQSMATTTDKYLSSLSLRVKKAPACYEKN